MTRAFAVVVGLLLLVLLVLFSTTYTVRFHEVAVKTTFGKEETVQDDPGVHFRYPLFIDRVTTYDKRVQLVETPLVETPTVDGQSVMVRAFLMWRVDPDNVLRFAQSYPDQMSDADRPLREQLQTAVRGGLGRSGAARRAPPRRSLHARARVSRGRGEEGRAVPRTDASSRDAPLQGPRSAVITSGPVPLPFWRLSMQLTMYVLALLLTVAPPGSHLRESADSALSPEHA